jgi:hypothetical protein
MMGAMGRIYVLLFFLGLIMAVFALISCLSAEDGEVRGLPRIVWVLIILFFPLLGSVVYFLAGRPIKAGGKPVTRRPGAGFPEPPRPKRPLAPDDDPEFLKQLDAKGKREDEDLLRRWEEDLRRREDDLRKPGKSNEDVPPDS